jgi:hypothetical protein
LDLRRFLFLVTLCSAYDKLMSSPMNHVRDLTTVDMTKKRMAFVARLAKHVIITAYLPQPDFPPREGVRQAHERSRSGAEKPFSSITWL